MYLLYLKQMSKDALYPKTVVFQNEVCLIEQKLLKCFSYFYCIYPYEM